VGGDAPDTVSVIAGMNPAAQSFMVPTLRQEREGWGAHGIVDSTRDQKPGPPANPLGYRIANFDQLWIEYNAYAEYQMADQTIPSAEPSHAPFRLRLVDGLNIFFGLTTVLGFVLAWYWHAQSVQVKAPLYFVGPERTRIVDTSVSTPRQLQVLYAGKSLSSNVSAVLVYFWNDGKMPIKAADVLDGLTVELDSDSQILDSRLLKVTRPVTKFSTGESTESVRNSLPLSFAILEQGDGAVLQIIYMGNPNTSVRLRGTIEGAGQPKRLDVAKTRPDSRYGHTLLIFVWVGAILMPFFILFVNLLDGRGPIRPTWKLALGLFMVSAPFLLLAGLATLQTYRPSQSVPAALWSDRQ
jgi:hypothetical protein